MDTLSLDCLSKKTTKRNADFSPIPGNFENSVTASDMSFEEYFMVTYYRQKVVFVSCDTYLQIKTKSLKFIIQNTP
jgi:hypothetical protein